LMGLLIKNFLLCLLGTASNPDKSERLFKILFLSFKLVFCVSKLAYFLDTLPSGSDFGN